MFLCDFCQEISVTMGDYGFCDGSSANGIVKVWKQSNRRSETATAGVVTVLFPAAGFVIVEFSAFSSSLTPQIYGLNCATGRFSVTYDQQWQR